LTGPVVPFPPEPDEPETDPSEAASGQVWRFLLEPRWLAWHLFAVVAVWMLVAMVVAVRQALDYTSTARAVAVCVVGWVLAIAFAVAFGLLLATNFRGFTDNFLRKAEESSAGLRKLQLWKPQRSPAEQVKLARLLAIPFAITPAMSSSWIPIEATLAGSTWIRTAGFCWPPIATWATPEICEICWATTFSAKSSTWGSGTVSEFADTIRIGESAGLTLR